MTGRITETYAAAIQHDLVDLEGATAVGVVRRPAGWFHGLVDENVRALGPPDSLLDAVVDRREDLEAAGLCDPEAHNAACEEVAFLDRYREYLREDEEAMDAVAALQARVRDGEDVALVCFEADDKRCHRHVLLDVLGEDIPTA